MSPSPLTVTNNHPRQLPAEPFFSAHQGEFGDRLPQPLPSSHLHLRSNTSPKKAPRTLLPFGRLQL